MSRLGVIVIARTDGYCTNSTYTTNLRGCLECALTHNIWQYYGDDVASAAKACSDSVIPSASTSSVVVTATGSSNTTATSTSTTSASASSTVSGAIRSLDLYGSLVLLVALFALDIML